MKNNSLFKKMLTGAAVLALTTVLFSCKKDDVDETGSANVKIVNASSTSSAQSFYLAGNVVVQGGLSFGSSSPDYIVTNSGNRLELQFRNEGSSSAYAAGNFSLDRGGYYTVFLAGDGQSARVKVYPDDLSAAASGKAKVRFIHLSNAAPANIDIRSGATTNLVSNLALDNASNYVSIDPGVLSLQVYAAGQSNSLGNFDLTQFAAGKIYTVYITGSTTNDISVRQVSHN
ncbi:DUF4397 domain-containing protein [Pedobacter metabolipauper]|uniref:Uncharacterized protein DUF4397 n=1 Tax=Pedobacter metabolipauper TaxID=425513 RepID=A0A4R6SSJ2_9SPHI|nr:DUF4397 domain-containing protein [Pedobacter metabolipauper]TDQ08355.1 uncharacterized protein DUF4397 [Pedobacter metabolipauper]